MEKPIIAVLGGHHSAGHDQYDCVDHVYCERIVEAGALPILLPAAEDDTGLAQLLRLCSGMLLPGGADVDPRFYHQEPLPQLGALDSALDRGAHGEEYGVADAWPLSRHTANECGAGRQFVPGYFPIL